MHEYEVPDLDVTVTVGIGRTWWAARHFGAMVIEYFTARPARPGIGHLPEIVGAAAGLVADAHDTICRHADLFGPDIVRFIVGLVHRHPQLVLGQFVNAGEQLPRVLNRILFEIITKAEIAQHLEKRVMPRGIANVFQIIVLAAGAHAALRGGSAYIVALVLPEKHILELHHAGIGKQQRGIVARHQWTRGDDGVALARKVVEKLAANFITVHAGSLPMMVRKVLNFNAIHYHTGDR